jgi:hypothetical protein
MGELALRQLNHRFGHPLAMADVDIRCIVAVCNLFYWIRFFPIWLELSVFNLAVMALASSARVKTGWVRASPTLSQGNARIGHPTLSTESPAYFGNLRKRRKCSERTEQGCTPFYLTSSHLRVMATQVRNSICPVLTASGSCHRNHGTRSHTPPNSTLVK